MNRRHAIVGFLIALLATAIVAGLHARGVLLRGELALADWVTHGSNPTRYIPNAWQYSLVGVISLAVAWLTMTTRRRERTFWIVLALVAELVALMWVCAFYRVLFQPLPLVLGALLSFGGVWLYLTISERSHSAVPLSIFNGRLSREQIDRIRAGEIAYDGKANSDEASILVCDLADKYELSDQSEPAVFSGLSEAFTQRARAILLEAGAYLESADGEGIVAVFGFPERVADHAMRAVHAAFALARAFAEPTASSNGEASRATGINVGVSSGTLLTAPGSNRGGIFVMSESIELARRFCVANRFYGSRVLIGPRTFELTSAEIVARPIDFLSGVSAQERHEVYEPLALAADVPPELLARRDSFWNGVVLYREKRWAEAYNEFQRARGPDNEEDAPLSLYLRRLEPLALQLAESPGE